MILVNMDLKESDTLTTERAERKRIYFDDDFNICVEWLTTDTKALSDFVFKFWCAGWQYARATKNAKMMGKLAKIRF